MSLDKRELLLRVLAEYQPTTPQESEHRATIMALVREHNDIFSADCQVGHITASALVVDESTQQVLLHFHKKLQCWLQFGGHSEPDDTTPAMTALRETQEETGLPDLYFVRDELLDVDVHPIPADNFMPDHLHLDFRYLLGTHQPDAVYAAEDESDVFRWMTFAEALETEGIDEGLARLIRKAQDYLWAS
jgi:8-oxo-dGTP pyrophosphatase MutT (NUDIX family)